MTDWEPYRIAPVDLQVDVVAGEPVHAGAGHAIQWASDVEIGVWYGADGTLERWREGMMESWPDAAFGPEEAVTLAGGLPARRVVAHLPPERAEGGFATPDGGFEIRRRDTPARTITAVALVRDGVPVLATVSAADAAQAAHVLDSLRPV